MNLHLAASTTGPLSKMAGSLGIPESLDWTSQDPYHLWSLTAPDTGDGPLNVWAILAAGAAVARDLAAPQFRSVDDWLPGMTVLFERQSSLKAVASAEVSALWTSVTAPLKTALAGDIGLDLDLGLRARAQWTARRRCWWSVERPTAARLLRVRLFTRRDSASTFSVKGVAVVGLDQATRNALGIIAGKYRSQLLALPEVDQLTARLERAALKTMEKSVEASVSAVWERQDSSEALLDADFDFTASASLHNVFSQCLGGDLTAVLSAPLAGLTLRACSCRDEFSRRRTFTWRLPFSSGSTSARGRLQTAMEALDTANGRIVRGTAKAESERRTRNASSLLTMEGVFAAHLGPGVVVHSPAELNARFVLDLRTRRPLTLQPLLNLYAAGPADPLATGCHLEITLAPESVASWLESQDPAAVSRRLQTAWRTLLPSAIDMAAFDARSLAPLLVWSALPITTTARRTSAGLQLNRPGGIYWNWPDPQLREAMVWNPQTRAALELRLRQVPFAATPDQLRRTLAEPVGAAVFVSLLQTEAEFVDRLTSTLRRAAATASSDNPVATMRHLSTLLAGLISAFHGKLSSVYGDEAARALGPLLLSSASPEKPRAEVTWTR